MTISVGCSQEMCAAAAGYRQAIEEFEKLEGKSVQCEQAGALLKANFKVKADTFGDPQLTTTAGVRRAREQLDIRRGRLADALAPLEQAVANRMSAALELALAPEVAAKIPDGPAVSKRSRELLAAVVRVNSGMATLVELRHAQWATIILAQNIAGNEQNQSLITELQKLMATLHRLIGHLQQSLAATNYPFTHGRGKVTIAAYCVESPPAGDDLGALAGAAGDILERLPMLLVRAMSQLAVAAEHVEQAVGLPLLAEPSET